MTAILSSYIAIFNHKSEWEVASGRVDPVERPFREQ